MQFLRKTILSESLSFWGEKLKNISVFLAAFFFFFFAPFQAYSRCILMLADWSGLALNISLTDFLGFR